MTKRECPFVILFFCVLLSYVFSLFIYTYFMLIVFWIPSYICD